MKEFTGTVIGGIGVIAVMYVLLAHATNVQKIASQATSSYGQVAKTFQGTPGV